MAKNEIKKILIVEDEKFNINVLIDILKPRYKTLIAKDGEKALKRIKKIKPDLILLDIMLPAIDGFEVCKILKNKKETKDIPVIFMTAKQNSDDIIKGLKLGAVDYVIKPVNYMELLSRIKTHINLADKIEKLKKSNEKIRNMSSLLPICPKCKKIKDDAGYWDGIENYISTHSQLEFSHSICPSCVKELYPEISIKNNQNKKANNPSPKKRQSKPNILIIEDETFNINVLKDMLSPTYKTHVAKDGSKGLEVLRSTHIDLVLLDILMTGMNGYQVCEEIQNDEALRKIPVIFMTVKRETNDVIKAFQTGAVDYITKPINYDELLARVKTHLLTQKTIKKLERAKEEIRTLSGLLPICSNCKKIRDDQGYWNDVENYLKQRSNINFLESLCPDCKAKEIEKRKNKINKVTQSSI